MSLVKVEVLIPLLYSNKSKKVRALKYTQCKTKKYPSR